jgi:hypothetical protein
MNVEDLLRYLGELAAISAVLYSSKSASKPSCNSGRCSREASPKPSMMTKLGREFKRKKMSKASTARLFQEMLRGRKERKKQKVGYKRFVFANGDQK